MLKIEGGIRGAFLAVAAWGCLSACSNSDVTDGDDGARAADGAGSELFRASAAELQAPPESRDISSRTMLVTLDEEVFADGASALRKVGGSVVIRTFGGDSLTLVVEKVESLEPGRYVSSGSILGIDHGAFVIAFDNGTAFAEIEAPGRGSYRIEFAGEGKHRLLEKTGYAPACARQPTAPGLPGLGDPPPAPVEPDESAAPLAEVAAPLAKASAVSAAVPYVDVAVFYTAAAATEAGGVSAIHSQIDLAISQANQAFANSKVNLRVRLARREQVAYTQSGNLDTDLSRLQGKTDGHMDGIHAVRDTYKADLVCLWVGYATPAYAGLGYVMTSGWRKTGFNAYAFSVVVRKYATIDNTFGHELAHNMGCDHDPAYAGGGAYPHSLGYHFTAGGVAYRTVMAYYPGKSVPYFSNPNVLYAGVKTGVAGSYDNALSLNSLKDTVALFRNGTPTVSLTAPAGGTTYSAGATVTLNASASDADGSVSKVEFYRGSTLIASDASSPYSVNWTGATSGPHSLTAKVFDNKGGTRTSSAVSITVNSSGIKTMNPAADARVRGGTYAAANYGTSNPLEVQTNGTASNNRDSYLKFSITSVPKVTKARLRFYANLSASGSVTTTVHDVSSTSWIESGTGGITWNNKPVRGSSRGTFTVASTGLKWHEVDVTSYVAAQKSAGKTVVGFALHNAASGSILVKVNSREAAGKPELVLTP